MKYLRRWWTQGISRGNRLWFTQVISSVLAILLALAAAWGAPLFEEGALPVIELETLNDLLTVIASSMLAVTTFSLSIMVGAFGAAANSATPRATLLVMDDDGTRTAIATFLSAFIFAIVAKIALGLSYYGSNGRFILFLGTLGVLILLLVTLVRWVKTLSSLGTMGNTLNKISTTAITALGIYWRAPSLGGRRGAPKAEEADLGTPMHAKEMGYLQHIDMDLLQQQAERLDADIHLRVRPGTLISPGCLLACLAPRHSQSTDPAQLESAHKQFEQALHDSLHMGPTRDFDQDPFFGVIVMSEVGQRALSAAVNDLGSSIDVITRLVTVLLDGEKAAGDKPAPALLYDRVTLVPLDEGEFVAHAFAPLVCDGAGVLSFGIRLQKLLGMLARGTHSPAVAQAARAMALEACERAEATMSFPADQALIRRVYEEQHAEAPVAAHTPLPPAATAATA